jgi:hypothetical protein
MARDAVSACRDVQSESTIQHNFRTYLYASAFGRLDGIEYDPEALFVATMFHDQGAYEIDPGGCFTLRGAEEAERLLLAAERDPRLAASAAQAVTLHLNPVVTVELGAEAHLLHEGVLLDAVGLRAWDLAPTDIDAVRTSHPRDGFSQEGARLLRAQARAIPRCRTAAAIRTGFLIALRVGPWQD